MTGVGFSVIFANVIKCKGNFGNEVLVELKQVVGRRRNGRRIWSVLSCFVPACRTECSSTWATWLTRVRGR